MATRGIPASQQGKRRDFLIGFIGWWVINALVRAATAASFAEYYMFMNVFILPVNVVALLLLLWRRRYVGWGVLATYAVNFLLALVAGLWWNGACWIPFYAGLDLAG